MATAGGSRSPTTLIIAGFALVAVVVLVLLSSRGGDEEPVTVEVAPTPPLASQSPSARPRASEPSVSEPQAPDPAAAPRGAPRNAPAPAVQRPGDRPAPGDFDVTFDASIQGVDRQELVEDLAKEARRSPQPEMPASLRRAIDQGTINTIPPEFEDAIKHQPEPPPEVREMIERGETIRKPPPELQRQFEEAMRRMREQQR